MEIDWSRAPDWADCVIRSLDDALNTLYWAEPWGTKDGRRCEFGAEYRRNDWISIADTASKTHRWVLVVTRPLQVSDLIDNGWLESPSLHIQQIGRAKRKLSEWTGDGLPPTGAVCEHHKMGGIVAEGATWIQVKIVAQITDDKRISPVAVFMPCDGNPPYVGQGAADTFRPIRTPEQISAEEKGRAVTDMLGIVCDPALKGRGVSNQLEALYNAGYRKIEP